MIRMLTWVSLSVMSYGSMAQSHTSEKTSCASADFIGDQHTKGIPSGFIFKTSQPKHAELFSNLVFLKGQKFTGNLDFLKPEKDQVVNKNNEVTIAPASSPSCEGADALMKVRRSRQAANP